MNLNPKIHTHASTICLALLLGLSSLSPTWAQDADDKDARIRKLEQQIEKLRETNEKDARLLLLRDKESRTIRGPVSPGAAIAQPAQPAALTGTADGFFATEPARRPTAVATRGLVANVQSTARVDPFGRLSVGYNGFVSREDAELGNKINDMIRSMKSADDEKEKAKIKAELKEQLEKQYDNYLAKLEEPLKKMESRLAKLQEEFTKRKEARDELVKLKLDNLWYEANGMGWPGNSRNSNLRFPSAPTVWSVERTPRSSRSLFRRPSKPAETTEEPLADDID